MDENTPAYYRVTDEIDLTDALIERFGKSIVLDHLIFECIQYLWRCGIKSNTLSDIRKVHHITGRIIKLLES